MRPLFLSCSWCHNMNPIDQDKPNYCLSCGHRADKPKSACNCQRCLNWRSANTADATRTACAFTRVVGRGFKAPVMSWTCSKTHAVLRVEDEKNPELWIEISLASDAVVALMGGMLTAQTKNEEKVSIPLDETSSS